MVNDVLGTVHAFLNNRWFFALVVAASVALGLRYNLGYPFGLAVCLVTLVASRADFSAFGLSHFNPVSALLSALGYTLLILVLVDLLLDPFLSKLRHEEVDLSAFAPLKGNLQYLLRALTIVLITAAVGEEFFYRGYVLKRMAVYLGDGQLAWWTAAIISSVIFGLAHYYQGVNGILTTGVTGFILAIAFMRNPQNLAVCMLTHGLYDIFGLLMLFLGRSNMISDFAKNTLFKWM